VCCVLFARACFEEISLVPVSRDIFFDFLGENAPFKGKVMAQNEKEGKK